MKVRELKFIKVALILVVASATKIYCEPSVSPKQREEDDSVTARYADVQKQLEESLKELTDLRERIAAQNIPLSKKLSLQEELLLEERDTLEDLRSKLDIRNLGLNNLRSQIESRKKEKSYLSNLLGEYVRNLETQLHIVQRHHYQPFIEAAKLALENENLSSMEVFEKQLHVVEKSIQRLEELNGGGRFTGKAVDESGKLKEGQFVMLGPVAYFDSNDGTTIGLAVERLGSLEPNILAFQDSTEGGPFWKKNLEGEEEKKDYQQMIRDSVRTGVGWLPFDSTLGKAQKIAETKETLVEHMQKGGIVMIPILGLAALALFIAFLKWVQLARVPMPSERKIITLLSDFHHRRHQSAKDRIAQLKGPVSHMLQTAIDHINEPKELVEEMMYEKILETRMRLNKGLPFIAVCASSAPLLGLLGTVTGIISTFKLITAFGAGDVKMLSGGISEALVTTEFGLIVAIPSLLFHAFLNRRAKSLVDRMEKTAVGVMNQINATPPPVKPEDTEPSDAQDDQEELLAQPAVAEAGVAS